MKKRIVVVISLFLIAVLSVSLVSCGSSRGSSKDYMVEENYAEAYPSEKPSDSVTSSGGDGTKIIKKAHVTAETKEYDKSTESLEELIESVGGHIANSSIRENGSYRNNGKSAKYADYTIKVPSDKFDSFLSSLKSSFNITNLTTSTEDVSESYLTLQARISTLEAKREGLVSMLQNVDVNTDFATWQQINAELTEIDTQLNIYTEQLNSLENKVAYATVTLSVAEVFEYTQKDNKDYGEAVADAFKDSFESAGEFFKELFLVFIYALPFLTIVLVIATVATVIIICSLKKKKAKEKKKEDKKENE